MLRTRDPLRDSITEIVVGARESALLIIGDVGSGKTTLLEELSHAHPHASVMVRINYGEVTWPLSGASALLSAIGDPRVSEFAGRFTLREDVSLAAAAGELLIVLRGLGLGRTTLLVDDIDRMDPASRQLVGYMCNHLGGSGLSIVATASGVPPEGSLAGVPFARVGPIDDQDAEHLAPRGTHPGTLRLLTWSSGGNLAAIVEQFDALSREQREGRDPLRFPLPPGPPAWAMLARSVHSLSADAAALLDRLAMCAVHGRSSVSRWMDGAEDSLHELLDLGIAADTRGLVHIRDNLLRSAVAAGLPVAVRRELNAELLPHADPLIAPWHAAFAEPDADHRSGLLRSAVGLTRLGRPGPAVEFSDRALRLDRSGLGDGLAELADALLLSGEIELAERTIAQAWLDAGDHPALARVHSRIQFAAGRPARGFDVVQLARASRFEVVTMRTVDPPVAAMSAWSAILAEDFAEARRLIAHLATTLDRPSRLWSGWATALGIDCAARSGHFGDAFELARDWDPSGRGGAGPDSFIPLSVWHRISVDDVGAARAVLREWTTRAPSRVGPLPAASGFVLEAALAHHEGDADRELELLQLADELAVDLGDPSFSRHHADLVEALLTAGRSATARDVLERFESAAALHPTRWATLALARARVAIAAVDDVLAAVSDARSLARPSDSPFERGKLMRTIGARLAEIGELDDARRADDDARVAFTSAGAHAWAESIAPHRPTRLAESAAARAAGSAADRDALLSADPSASASPGSAITDSLTRDEHAVVDLVSRGLKNKEIAAQLFISVRTVELRLTHIYRKTGARSRSHLLSLMR